MSGFERLDRLSLPRRTRRRAGRQRNGTARRQDKGNDRGLEAYKITAPTNVRFWGGKADMKQT